jgi:hypothetical protein
VEKQKELRKSSKERGELYARIRDLVLDFNEQLGNVVKREREVFGSIEITIAKSKTHVSKIMLADKPRLELNAEAHRPEGE